MLLFAHYVTRDVVTIYRPSRYNITAPNAADCRHTLLMLMLDATMPLAAQECARREMTVQALAHAAPRYVKICHARTGARVPLCRYMRAF